MAKSIYHIMRENQHGALQVDILSTSHKALNRTTDKA